MNELRAKVFIKVLNKIIFKKINSLSLDAFPLPTPSKYCNIATYADIIPTSVGQSLRELRKMYGAAISCKIQLSSSGSQRFLRLWVK